MKKKHFAAVVLLTVFTVLTAVIILWFSSKTADDSSAQSGAVTDMILRLFCPDYSNMSKAEQMRMIRQASVYVRKAAHITEFAVFGLLCTLLLGCLHRLNPRILKRYMVWAIAAGLCLAALDEFSQLHVSGRSGSIQDVGIDMIGVAIGTAAGWLITKCRDRVRT